MFAVIKSLLNYTSVSCKPLLKVDLFCAGGRSPLRWSIPDTWNSTNWKSRSGQQRAIDERKTETSSAVAYLARTVVDTVNTRNKLPNSLIVDYKETNYHGWFLREMDHWLARNNIFILCCKVLQIFHIYHTEIENSLSTIKNALISWQVWLD